MATKLTLTVEEKNIRFAKRMAKKSKTSVSKMVNDYFYQMRTIEELMAKEPVNKIVKKHGGSWQLDEK
jgi:hypothetical protein